MNNVAIEQIKIGLDNFCYVIFSFKYLYAAIVDPGYDPLKILDFIKRKRLKLKYIINTHHHLDHTSGNSVIKNSTNAKIVISKNDGNKINDKVELYIDDGDKLEIGDINLKFISTPGHTKGSICILVDNKALITGDTLFIGDCGRTDLNGGSPSEMLLTLKDKLMNLPDHLIVYPGHDYGSKPFDYLGNQKSTILDLINEIENYI
jgi:glyoxylase-like metal-dependent hydrolase (beta-lactamase superfamily II)